MSPKEGNNLQQHSSFFSWTFLQQKVKRIKRNVLRNAARRIKERNKEIKEIKGHGHGKMDTIINKEICRKRWLLKRKKYV